MQRLLTTATGFYVVLALAYVMTHAHHLADPPNGFHTWREIDTVTVAENFVVESADFLNPRVNLRGNGSGVVGMELPIYNYAAASFKPAAGDLFVAARLISLSSALMFLLALGWLFQSWSNQYARGERSWSLGVFAAAAAPLIFFYSAKIQPDMLGIAAMTLGCAAYWSWLAGPQHQRNPWLAVLSVLMLTVAGCIKPTMLAVGLPMLVGLLHADGLKALRRPTPWIMAFAILIPVGLWFRHARRLTEAYGNPYFYLGGDVWEGLHGLAKRSFYQNTLLTWPFELAIGLPAVPFFIAGLYLIKRRTGEATMLAAWVIGMYAVLALAGGHASTPHDYYFLPMVPCLAYIVGHGINAWTKSSHAPVRAVAAVLIGGMLVYGVLRTDGRHQQPVDVAAVRAGVATAGVEGLAVAIDNMPGALLFWTGLKGWRVDRNVTVGDLMKLAQEGARFIIVDARRGDRLNSELDVVIGQPVVATPDVLVYSLNGTKKLKGLAHATPVITTRQTAL